MGARAKSIPASVLADDLLEPWNPRQCSKCHRLLLSWARKKGRSLPWRSSRHPYRVWISEIMLQQTTVAAVIPYFERFLARFPDLTALADADEEEILRLWEGLGYYTRARNLHRCARVIVAEYEGQFPREVEELKSLPGIGRYTAGAIRSFAFDLPAPIVEANTLRLYCRLAGFTGDPKSSAGQAFLWRFAEIIHSGNQPAKVNEALMDLGATVCTPVAPNCAECPLLSHCEAARRGNQQQIPRPSSRPAITQLQEVAVVVHYDDQVLLRQRRADERWAGLWEFVRFPGPASDGKRQTEASIRQVVHQETGLEIDHLQSLGEIKYSVTRYRISLDCFVANRKSGRLAAKTGYAWIKIARLKELPLSRSARKLADRFEANR